MTRALVTFYDDKGKVICRMYRNGDGFPWDFGVTLAEFWASGLNFDGRVSAISGAEMENATANCVASFVADNPDYVLLISEDIGWGEDYRYDIHKPKDVVLITVSYPTLDHSRKEVTVTPQAFLDGIQKLDNLDGSEEKRWRDFDDHQDAFESVFNVETVKKD